MQETSRLVAPKRALRVLIALACITFAPATLLAQGAPRAQPEDSWGERERPEGYVKSKEPSKSESPYNWTQMGYASLVMLAMGAFIVYLVRRSTRKQRDEPSKP